MRNNELANTVDVFNFSESNLTDMLKLFLYEIDAMVSTKKHERNQPLVFTTSANKDKTPMAEQLIKFIKKNKISIIDPEFQNKKIEEIRETVG